MLRKARRLPGVVRLGLIIMLLGSISGCGDSTDPLGIGIVQFYDVSQNTVITSVSVQPGNTETLTVRVMSLRSDGTTAPVIGERVTFTLLTPANNGGLTVVNDRTAGNGQAMALYTAGNNFAVDSVRVTTGAGATATITINKTGGIIGGRISTLSPASATLTAGQTVVISATVTDGNNNPMMGEAVTFTIATNNSGGSFFNTGGNTAIVSTDAGGNALVIYQAGSNLPDLEVYDTVRAALANGSSNYVVITRSAGTPVVTGYVVTVSANPSSVAPSGTTVVTATVTDSNGVAAAGVAVTFSLTGGGTVVAGPVTTNGAGSAVTTYTAPAAPATGSAAVTATVTIGGVTYTGATAIDWS